MPTTDNNIPPPPMYRVRGTGGRTRDITAETLAEYCIERAGGGYTMAQTVKAMELQARAIETGKLSTNITIEVLS